MINLIFAFSLICVILWVAKKFYFPLEMAQHPEKYPLSPDTKISKKDLSIVLFNIQRWRKEGRISREEYDHMTDLCLCEMQQIKSKE